MATSLSHSLDTPSLHDSPNIVADTHLSTAANERRRPHKRRPTAPPDLLPRNSEGQGNKRPRLMQEHRLDNVHIIDDVDELIPKFRAMGQDPSLYSPQTGGLDSAFIPFVLDDGVLAFYTPSPDSSDQSNTFSPPASSASDASFLGVLPDQPRHGKQGVAPIFQNLSIWRAGDETSAHMYTQTVNQYPTHETVSLDSLDPSSSRYDAVHTAIAQLSCPFVHLDVSLATSPFSTVDKELVSSLVTMSNPRQKPVRLLMAHYNGETLVSSYEVQMEQSDSLHPDGAVYSAPLPQEFINSLVKGVDQGNSASDDSEMDLLDSIAVMRFVQQQDEQEAPDKSHDEETVLAAVCDFRVVKGDPPGKVHISHLISGSMSSQAHPYSPSSLPTPPPSRERLVDLAPSSFSGTSRTRLSNRAMPKLSVAIPPATNTHSGKGQIQLYSATPDSTTRRTPQTGVPHNVFPVTPYEQLIHTPLHPPEIQRSSTRSRYTPTPAESAYPFTLSSMSPGIAQSPAFGVLDSATGPGMSAPAWLTFPRNETPLTPSFFLQQPHTAAASSAMSSLTKRALDIGAIHKTEYFTQPLASPHPITSAPVFPAQADLDQSEPTTATGWSVGPHSPQSS